MVEEACAVMASGMPVTRVHANAHSPTKGFPAIQPISGAGEFFIDSN